MPSSQTFSRRQIDKLGQRLKAGEEPSEEDLVLLARYQESLISLYEETKEIVGAAFAIVLPEHEFEPSFRIKQYRSIAKKIGRMTTKLSKLQDLVGFRVIVPEI